MLMVCLDWGWGKKSRIEQSRFGPKLAYFQQTLLYFPSFHSQFKQTLNLVTLPLSLKICVGQNNSTALLKVIDLPDSFMLWKRVSPLQDFNKPGFGL